MSAPTILLTGATGFVGGTILTALTKTHPDSPIKALIRRESTAATLQSLHPNLTPVIGSLSDLPLLTSTASQCAFAIHAGGDDVPAVKAIIDGLASAGNAAAATGLISITGPRSLIDPARPVTGTLNPRVWSDGADIDEIFALDPDGRSHAGADQEIVAYGREKDVRTVLVSPGQIFGRGKGVVKRESSSKLYFDVVERRGRAFVVGEGMATWSWTSVGDLGRAVVFFLTQSLVERNQDVRGYYFVATGDVSMRDRAEAVAERLGLGEVERIGVEEARGIHPFGPIMWGCGERIRAERLRALGWEPEERDWRVLMVEEGGGRA